MRARHHCLIALAFSLAPQAAAQASLDAELVANGFKTPLQVVNPPGDASRLYVVEQRGRIRLAKQGVIQPTDFLDLSATVSQTDNSRGLLSLVFHPDFATNGQAYVLYTSAPDDHATFIVRYTTLPGNPEQLDPSTATTILGPLEQPSEVHNGGQMWFGLDGKLYVPLGDGGPPGDVNCLAQRGDTLLGKVLRLNDDGSVPGDNPFVGDPTVLDEIWYLGLRNPWRPSLDSLTGDLYLEDVGNNAFEELNIVPFGTPGGLNFGWKPMEGSACYSEATCQATVPPCGDASFHLPAYDYSHSEGCAIIGGFVYRGCSLPDYQGRYFFADWCTSKVQSLRYDGTGVQDLVDHSADLEPVITAATRISSFGQGADGTIYVVHRFGSVYRLVPDEPSLTADVSSVSLTEGGVQTFSLATWDCSMAGDVYLLLASGSGTTPGTPLAPGIVLPLNVPDFFFDYSLANANQPPYGGTFSSLDQDGGATATLTIPPGAPGNLLGVSLNHAFVVFDVQAGFAISFASDPTSTGFTP